MDNPKREDDAEMMFGAPEENTVDVMEHRAMVYLPENAVEVEVRAKVYMDGKVRDVSRTINMKELREAFRKADEGYIDEDDVFTLTDKGREYLDKLELE